MDSLPDQVDQAIDPQPRRHYIELRPGTWTIKDQPLRIESDTPLSVIGGAFFYDDPAGAETTEERHD